MRIGVLGIRGIPGRYGGFETFAEQVATRLVSKGHEVVVFNRGRRMGVSSYRGVEIRTLPAIMRKTLETPSHTCLSLLNAVKDVRRFDVLLVCNVGNSPLLWLARRANLPVVLNVDGLEWQRKKWSAVAKAYLRWAERVAAASEIDIVTDARVIQRYYKERYGRETRMIVYGATGDRTPHSEDRVFLERCGLHAGKYFLYVSRLEPENNARMVIEAFSKTLEELPLMQLAVVGDAPYAGVYKRSLEKLACRDGRVVMTGAIYGVGYQVLQRNALAYVHATEVGGTHPALVEGMAFGNCVLVLDTPENCEVAGSSALTFSTSQALSRLMRDVGTGRIRVEEWGSLAMEHARESYSWDAVASEYEELLYHVAFRSRGELAEGEEVRH